MSKCDCGSEKECSAHYYAGKLIAFDCPKCWQKNDDARTKELMTAEEWDKWSKKWRKSND